MAGVAVDLGQHRAVVGDDQVVALQPRLDLGGIGAGDAQGVAAFVVEDQVAILVQAEDEHVVAAAAIDRVAAQAAIQPVVAVAAVDPVGTTAAEHAVVAARRMDAVGAVVADDQAGMVVADHVVRLAALQADVLDVGVDLLTKAGDVGREMRDVGAAEDEGGAAAGAGKRGGEAGAIAVGDHHRVVATLIDAEAELGDRVAHVGQDQDLVAGAAFEPVDARAAVEEVVTATTEELVVATPAEELVVADTAIEQVVTGLALEQVVAAAAEQRVVAGAALEPVVAAGAVEIVVAGAADDMLVAVAPDEDVVAIGQHDLAVAAVAADIAPDRADFLLGRGFAGLGQLRQRGQLRAALQAACPGRGRCSGGRRRDGGWCGPSSDRGSRDLGAGEAGEPGQGRRIDQPIAGSSGERHAYGQAVGRRRGCRRVAQSAGPVTGLAVRWAAHRLDQPDPRRPREPGGNSAPAAGPRNVAASGVAISWPISGRRRRRGRIGTPPACAGFAARPAGMRERHRCRTASCLLPRARRATD